MAKFHGEVGYVSPTETAAGVWEEVITPRMTYGDVIRNARRMETSENLNDNLALSNSFSLMLDAYSEQNFSAIRYVEWMGTRWKVTNVEVQRPRLILTIGGVYNG